MAIAAATLITAGTLPSFAQAPKSPVTINVVDVAGDLALTQDAFELYAKKNPNMVAKFNFTKAPSPELPGKLKAMQGAGRSDIDIVLTGTDFLAAGIEQGLLVKIHAGACGEVPQPDGELPAGRRRRCRSSRWIRELPWPSCPPDPCSNTTRPR